jgi:hypothetical protein
MRSGLLKVGTGRNIGGINPGIIDDRPVEMRDKTRLRFRAVFFPTSALDSLV